MQKAIMTLKNIEKIAEKIAEKIKKGAILLLIGDLGAGKTTLSKEIAKKIGIKQNSIKSPTYSYIRAFPEKNFYHIDLYRIENEDELLEAEIEELFKNTSNIILIEWANKLKNPPKNAQIIELKYLNEEEREINFLNF
jgi:tRNA threonylcarbamoyladenosine biosynthesis protein TsaE